MNMHTPQPDAPGPAVGPPSTHLDALEMLALVLNHLTFRQMHDLAKDLHSDLEGAEPADLAWALQRWAERMQVRIP